MDNGPNVPKLNISPLTAYYMPRLRINRILDRMTRCKLVYVVAGAGYGKTQAVYHYVEEKEDAIVRWVHLTEGDNIGSHYWENLTHTISLDNPDLAVKLRELGFPKTHSLFKQFAEIIINNEHRSNKTFLVLDNFHLINSEEALTFAERCAHLQIQGACVIIISRTEPEINTVSLFTKGNAGIITEEELRFTEQEIAEFLRLHDIPFSVKELPRYIDATKGWALAVKLLMLVQKRVPKNLDFALKTMKQNVYNLFETEAWDGFSESIQKTIVKLSLVSDLPITPLYAISNDDFLKEHAPQLASFMWFDSFTGDYWIHPLYLEFLKGKQTILSEKEKQNSYRRVAQWCSDNNLYMDAMLYYSKSYQYDLMLKTFLSHPFKQPPDTCEFFLNILEGLDLNVQEQADDHSFLLLTNFLAPLLLIGAGKYEEAKKKCLAIIREWEKSDDPFANNILSFAYSNLAYADIYNCTATHEYKFPEYMKKSVEYYKKSSIPPLQITGAFGVADIRSYSCLVGINADFAEFDRFLEITRETVKYIAETTHKMYYGYDDLTACEIAFFKNQTDSAKNFANSAILKTREAKQYSLEMMAEQYLLRIATQEGNISLVKEVLQQMKIHLDNADFWSRNLLYDLFVGSFYSQIGLTKMVPAWFDMYDKETASEIRIPMKELVASVRYYISCKKYDQALTILCKSYPREPQEQFLFSELGLLLMGAAARYGTGDIEGAVSDFEKAYEISFCGEFEMFFIELGNELLKITAAALKKTDCKIPKEWLKAIGLKASIYSKRAAAIANAIKAEKGESDAVSLSARELEVLNDMYLGLSREEIAANRYLSVNTVKKILQSIYIKLDANSNVDAVRIATEKKLI